MMSARSRVLVEKLIVPQLVRKFPAFYGTRRFITAFTRTRCLSLSQARSIQPRISHYISWTFTSIFSYHLCLSLSSGPFPSGFHLNPVLHMCYLPRPYSARRTYMKLLHVQCPPVTPSFLGLKYPPQPTIREHLHPMIFVQCDRPGFTPIQKKTGKIETKDSWPEGSWHPRPVSFWWWQRINYWRYITNTPTLFIPYRLDDVSLAQLQAWWRRETLRL